MQQQSAEADASADEPYVASDLVAKFESLNAGFFTTEAENEDDEDDDEEENAQLLSAIAASMLTPTSISEAAWQITSRDGIGRVIVASRPIPADSVVFRENPLVAAEVTEESDTLKGEMAAVAVELLKLPADSPAKLLQEPSYLAAGEEDEDAQRSCRDLHQWSDSIVAALASREIWREGDGTRVECTADAVRWALGVATVNSHGAYEPTRGVLGILASMMQHECAPSTAPSAPSASVWPPPLSPCSLISSLTVSLSASLSLIPTSTQVRVELRRGDRPRRRW